MTPTATVTPQPSRPNTQALVDPANGATISPLFASLGVTSGFQPPDPYATGWVLLSFSGEGKSTFLSSIPHSLLLEFNANGAGSVVGSRNHRVPISTWAQYEKVRDALLSSKASGNCPYKFLAFDTADEWWQIAADYAITVYNATHDRKAASIGEVGGEGKGYAIVGDLIEAEMKKFIHAGFGWAVSGHLREKDINEGNNVKKTVIRPVLPDSTFGRINRMAYVKAQILIDLQQGKETKSIPMPDGTTKTIEVATGQLTRRYYLRIRTNQLGDENKVRLPTLPETLAFPQLDAWKEFLRVWETAVAQARQQDTRSR